MKTSEIIRTASFSDSIRQYIFLSVAFILLITIVGIPVLLVWLLGLGQVISRKYHNSLQCYLTPHHLAYKKGVFFKVEKTIPLENIQDLTFIENPILNHFQLKILKIETAGNSRAQTADMKLIGIIDANEFKEAVLTQREMLKDGSQRTNINNDSEEEMISLLREIRDLLKK